VSSTLYPRPAQSFPPSVHGLEHHHSGNRKSTSPGALGRHVFGCTVHEKTTQDRPDLVPKCHSIQPLCHTTDNERERLSLINLMHAHAHAHTHAHTPRRPKQPLKETPGLLALASS
jgi:hypothetical protein